MKKNLDIIKDWQTPFTKTTEQAWAEMQPKMAANNASAKVIALNWKPLVSVAAAAAIIIAVITIWPKDELIRMETASREMETVVLPDQSTMILNAGSVAQYDEDWEDDRALKLEGQAFFQVKKGSKFTVVTDEGIVEVLGTSFDVFARDGRFRVECRTGKVRVTSGKNTVEITPGNVAELSEGTLAISQADLSIADWQTGEFFFTDEPLENVFNELQRQFNVVVSGTDLSNRFYTGHFSNKSLDEALELVCLPMGLRFEIKDETHVLIHETTR